MADQVELKQYFAVPLLTVRRVEGFEAHQERLREFVLRLRRDTPGEQRSNVKGWHSQYDLHLVDQPDLRWLLAKISEVARNGYNLIQPKGMLVPKIVALWANVNEAGGYNAPHAHPAHLLSGVFYVDVDAVSSGRTREDRDGAISFHAPLPHVALLGGTPSVRFRPHDGMLMIFPGYLNHMVHPHHRDSPRISMAFNIDAGTPPTAVPPRTQGPRSG